MEKILIAAIARNRAIGKDNALLWHIPEELKHFKKTTIGFPMIMGRKTFASLPAPLPGRRHIVLSRNADYHPKDAEVVRSIEEALQLCQGSEKVFIIGGGQIFTIGLAIADTLILSHLHRDFEGDTYFPEFSHLGFEETDSKEYPEAKEPFTVVTYKKTRISE